MTNLQNPDGLVMINIHTGDSINRNHFIVDLQPGLICRATRRHPRYEDPLVIAFERCGSKPSSNAQSQAFVRSAEGYL